MSAFPRWFQGAPLGTEAEPARRSVRVEARRTAAGDARTGGDLYDVVDTPFGIRAIIGDVTGHGRTAAGLADEVCGAFGELAGHEPRLPGLAQRLDAVVAARVGEWCESFVTASLVQIGKAGTTAELLVCGHPLPLVMRAGVLRPASVLTVALPLGLRHMDQGWHPPATIDFAAGDALLLYTDGAIEARDGRGEMYPFERRAAELAGEPPAVLLERLEAELLAHCGGRAKDDIALLHLRAEIDP